MITHWELLDGRKSFTAVVWKQLGRVDSLAFREFVLPGISIRSIISRTFEPLRSSPLSIWFGWSFFLARCCYCSLLDISLLCAGYDNGMWILREDGFT